MRDGDHEDLRLWGKWCEREDDTHGAWRAGNEQDVGKQELEELFSWEQVHRMARQAHRVRLD